MLVCDLRTKKKMSRVRVGAYATAYDEDDSHLTDRATSTDVQRGDGDMRLGDACTVRDVALEIGL